MPKKPESFWATVKAIWKLFSTTFGNVRVDFCQPFSLKVELNLALNYFNSRNSVVHLWELFSLRNRQHFKFKLSTYDSDSAVENLFFDKIFHLKTDRIFFLLYLFKNGIKLIID